MSLSDIPSRAEFIRDQLAEHLVGLGCFVFDEKPGETEFEWPSLAYEAPCSVDSAAVCVDTEGTIRPLVGFASPAPLIFPGFAWVAQPTDTGVMHGPPTCGAAMCADGMLRRCGVDEPLAVGHRIPGTTGAMHGPTLPTASELNDWPYRYADSGPRRYSGPYVNRSGFRVDPLGRERGTRLPNDADRRRRR